MKLTKVKMVRAKLFNLVNAFSGEPKLTDFQLVEEDLLEVNDGEFLAEALYLSVDPYMRKYMSRYPVGTQMIGGQVAKVLETKHKDFPKSSVIFGQFGWRTHTVVNPAKITEKHPFVLPELGSHPYSLGIGVLGSPGNSAYFGFLELCQPKFGETVVVSGAAGAVGSLVGQIAKIKGCKVIGFAGSDDKCTWLEKELGFDKAINYKKGNLAEHLKAAAPNGVDCYFDNVGGEITSIIMTQMNLYGRISVCGCISGYNDQSINVADPQRHFITNQLTMQGFSVHRWADQGRWMEGITQMLKWVQEGKIKYRETVTQGFENQPKAFIEMLRGHNTGKAIVKV